jgi:hypothetical protein
VRARGTVNDPVRLYRIFLDPNLYSVARTTRYRWSHVCNVLLHA